MMTCETYSEIIESDAELTDELLRQLGEHLEACPECRMRWGQATEAMREHIQRELESLEAYAVAVGESGSTPEGRIIPLRLESRVKLEPLPLAAGGDPARVDYSRNDRRQFNFSGSNRTATVQFQVWDNDFQIRLADGGPLWVRGSLKPLGKEWTTILAVPGTLVAGLLEDILSWHPTK